MSKEKQEGKKAPYRMFYGVNAAAMLTLAEVESRLEQRRRSADLTNYPPTRGQIQQYFIHYLRFIRKLSEDELA